MLIFRAIVVSLIPLLTACQSVAPLNQEALKPSKDTQQLTHWELRGGLAARNQHDSFTASMNWQQQGPNQLNMNLSGPLGGGAVNITQKGRMVTINEGKTQTSSRDVETLFQEKTGVRVPLNYFYYWIRGLKAPNQSATITRDANQRPKHMEQAGFTIDYEQYTQAGPYVLPAKIRVKGHGLLIKMVVRQWQVS